jgi:hypothetical protein
MILLLNLASYFGKLTAVDVALAVFAPRLVFLKYIRSITLPSEKYSKTLKCILLCLSDQMTRKDFDSLSANPQLQKHAFKFHDLVAFYRDKGARMSALATSIIL